MKNIYNKLMGIIFSRSTPSQLIIVTVLAYVFGFLPGFGNSPFLYLLIIALVLVLRLNIGMFVLIALFSKIISYPLEFVSFHIGEWALNSFLQPVFKAAVNTPLLAYSGFEYYLVTGAFILSLILGLVVGILIAGAYKKFVSKMANIQDSSEAYNKIANNLFVKIISKVVFGKNVSKVDWLEINNLKFRQPFRIWGVALVIIVVAIVSFSPNLLKTSMVSNIIKQQLTKINGATVDYDNLDVSISDAKLNIDGLAAANPNDLNKDRFYAQSLSASIDVKGLLTKQISLDQVVINGVSFDHKRSNAGKLFNSSTDGSSDDISNTINNQAIANIAKVGANMQQIDISKLSKNAKKSAEIAKNIKQGMQVLSSLNSSKEAQTNDNKDKQTQTVNENASVYGYANVKDDTLRDNTPDFTIGNLQVLNYQDKNTGDTYDAVLTNLSSNPTLLNKPTSISIKSVNNDDASIDLVISNQNSIKNTVKFDVKNLDGNIISGLSTQGITLNAKKVGISGDGIWEFSGVNNISLNIPLKLNLYNVDVSFANVKQQISEINLSAIISGDINNLSIGVDSSELKKSMGDIGVEVAKKQAAELLKKSGLNKNAQDLINNASINGKSLKNIDAKDIQNIKVNGKSIKNLNSKDVQNLASQFGFN